MSNSTLLSPGISIECPKCGKHTIVEQPTGTYRCIACDFKRDFSGDDESSSKKGRGRKQNRGKSGDRRKRDSEEEVNPFPLLLIGGILIVLLV